MKEALTHVHNASNAQSFAACELEEGSTREVREFTGLILAAGKGTRMLSSLPKVLHELGGVPMITRIKRSMERAGATNTVVIVGYEGDLVKQELGEHGVNYAWQPSPQQGTGHAVREALSALPDSGPVLIALGDMPLIPSEAFKQVVEAYSEQTPIVISTMELNDPTDYGRIIRDHEGTIVDIVEEKSCTPDQKAIRETNPSLYCVDAGLLKQLVPKIELNPIKEEYYLTDIVKLAVQVGHKPKGVKFTDVEAFVGINDRWTLLQAENTLRTQTLKAFVNAGVVLKDIGTIFIDPDVRIAAGTIIEPCTTITGETEIGPGCRIGPYSIIDDSKVGANATIFLSRISESVIGNDAKIGPFANLRPGSNLGTGVKIGNFVEVKKSRLDDGVSVSHLSYIGDASVGSNSNIGAGTITCNYDGFNKHRTQIGKDAFVGSNSTLVAPVTIGDGAFVAAGSSITKDVPKDALALGRARQEVKEEWAVQWRHKNENKH